MAHANEPEILMASCLCGIVVLELTLPSKWCAHCHCTMCRKAHGAGYVTWAGFEQDQFRLAAGADQLQWFESSTGASRGFCNQCGSSLLFRSERWPEEIHVAVGCIDGELDRRPEANVFFDTHVNWMQVDSSIRVVNP